MSAIEINVAYVMSAKLTYRGISVEIRTEPGTYEECRIKLMALVEEAKEGIDRAAETQASTWQAGI